MPHRDAEVMASHVIDTRCKLKMECHVVRRIYHYSIIQQYHRNLYRPHRVVLHALGER
jgi:hypothetical protein